MPNDALSELPQKVVRDLAHEQGWRLSTEGLAALTAAILPFVQKAADQSAPAIQRITLNYYLDGPMVQQMRRPGSRDGERLWAEWRAYMISLARTRGLAPADAEELAQEVYMQTARALPNFYFGSRLKTYFCGIFINCYRHWVRAARGLEQREHPLPTVIENEEDGAARDMVDVRPAPEAQVIEQMQNTQLSDLVAQEIQKIVSSEDFQILHLYYVERTFTAGGQERKWTDKEIGERLEMPLNTVTSRRLRAIQRLKNNASLRALFTQIMDVS